jgi:hypothetical protein
VCAIFLLIARTHSRDAKIYNLKFFLLSLGLEMNKEVCLSRQLIKKEVCFNRQLINKEVCFSRQLINLSLTNDVDIFPRRAEIEDPSPASQKELPPVSLWIQHKYYKEVTTRLANDSDQDARGKYYSTSICMCMYVPCVNACMCEFMNE